MDKLSILRRPVEAELARYKELFQAALSHDDDYLGQALDYVRRREGKMMRPLLVVLMAREYGEVKEESLLSAVTLELLHTASLVHDDVVDESGQRRGQRSVNAVFDNKVAVLVGDYLLSVSLMQSAHTGNIQVVEIISQLGATLSKGEVDQLANIRKEEISETAYFQIIKHKTAALFAACAQLGALSAGASPEAVERARKFGEIIGLCFQIRDDIFDYYKESAIGKPTFNDMSEGKLTLPAIYAVTHTDREDVKGWARKVKTGTATYEEMEALVNYTKQSGGMEYAEQYMMRLHDEAVKLLENHWHNPEVKTALRGYIDFVVDRDM